MNYRPQATPSKPGPCYRTGRPERWAAGPRVSQESCTSRPPRLCECALAVRIHAARQNSQRLPATGLRPATLSLPYLVSPRLVSSHLVSSAATRRYDHTTQECCRHQFLRPKDPRECYRHRLLASIPGSRPILVSSVSPHLIVSSLFSALSSHLVKSPGFPTGQQCGPLHSREQPPSPLSFYETIQGIDHSAAGRSGRTPARRWRPAPSSG